MSDISTNTISQHTVAVLNIALGAVLIFDVVLLGIMAFGCLLMSFSLFFMAAIPAFFLIGGLTIATLIAAVVNIGDGIGLAIAANKNRRVSTVFTVITMITDGIMLPVNIVALICGIYLLTAETDFLSIAITMAAAFVILLALISLILNLIKWKQSRHNVG